MNYVLLALLWMPAVALAQGEGWHLIEDKDGIKTFTKRDADSDVVSMKGISVLDASVEEIFASLKSNEQAARWMPMVESRYTLKQVSETRRIECSLVRMPWPLTDRYFINEADADFREDGSIYISIKSVPFDHKVEGRVLGHLNFSRIHIIPDGLGKTKMVVEINSDPKGWVPDWLVNLAQKRWPRDFFTGLDSNIKEQRVH